MCKEKNLTDFSDIVYKSLYDTRKKVFIFIQTMTINRNGNKHKIKNVKCEMNLNSTFLNWWICHKLCFKENHSKNMYVLQSFIVDHIEFEKISNRILFWWTRTARKRENTSTRKPVLQDYIWINERSCNYKIWNNVSLFVTP